MKLTLDNVSHQVVGVVQVQQKIDDLTDLDRVLYTAGKKEFEKVKCSAFTTGGDETEKSTYVAIR